MLLSKGAQLFPVKVRIDPSSSSPDARRSVVQEKLISMIMAMFAFVGDRLVRKDDLYSYQVMEKTIKTVIPSLYKVRNLSLPLSMDKNSKRSDRYSRRKQSNRADRF